MTHRATLPFIVVFFLGLIVGNAITPMFGFSGGARVRVVEGYAFADVDGTAIGFSTQQGGPGDGYVIAGANWRQQNQPWHDSFPTCVQPLVENQRVRLGIIRARPVGEAPGRSVVVWLECLD